MNGRRTRDATAADADTRRRIEQSTIDLVDADSKASEQAHDGQGLDDHRRPWFEGRAGRESKTTPFGYTLKVDGARPVSLVTTCRGSDEQPRTFDVLVNGTAIATDTLPLEPARLIDLEHPVPASLTRGLSSVTVTLPPARGQSDRGGLRGPDDHSALSAWMGSMRVARRAGR